MDALDTLRARGFVQQCTNEARLRKRLAAGKVTFYVGVDPTADSMHVGHLIPIMAAAWLQRAGHRPIVVLGGGTALVGDPTGKDEMRQMLDAETISANAVTIGAQIRQFVDVDGDRGMLVNNADWLMTLSYIPFLRDIGRQFSVNRMLSSEAYKQRLERGLSFIEFNYQILQSYDFLELHRRHGCTLQIGGDDQWGNIVAGTDLIRRCEQRESDGLTHPLIMTSEGKKMGKTARGAVWLAADRFSPFDFFQYWLNVSDADVGRLLRLYTFLDLEEIVRLEALQGADIREAKRVLARETTTLVHGPAEAARADAAARAMVSGAGTTDMPTATVTEVVRLVEVLRDAGLCKSLGEARRLIKGGAVKVDGEKIHDPDTTVGPDRSGTVVRVGKKRAVRLVGP